MKKTKTFVFAVFAAQVLAALPALPGPALLPSIDVETEVPTTSIPDALATITRMYENTPEVGSNLPPTGDICYRAAVVSDPSHMQDEVRIEELSVYEAFTADPFSAFNLVPVAKNVCESDGTEKGLEPGSCSIFLNPGPTDALPKTVNCRKECITVTRWVPGENGEQGSFTVLHDCPKSESHQEHE